MKYLVVDFARAQVGLSWYPVGVVLIDPPILQYRYRAGDAVAFEAEHRLGSLLDQAVEAVKSGNTSWPEALTRIGRSGVSGHLSWQVLSEVNDDASVDDLFTWYVLQTRQEPFAGARPLVFELPFG